MKNYKRVIFTLDNTLLIPDKSCEDEFLKTRIKKDDQEEFFNEKQDIINKYEFIFPKYDVATLSEYFGRHGFIVSEETIKDLIIYNGEHIIDTVVPGALELLEYLNNNLIGVVAMTTGFFATELARVKRAGIEPYLDNMICGDLAMKPDLESFYLAANETPTEYCLFVSNSEDDIKGALGAKIDSYLLDEEHTLEDLLLMFEHKKEVPIQLARKI